jgi:hypothetical protein
MSEYIRNLSLGRGELSFYERDTSYMAVIKSKLGIYAGRMIFEYLLFR